MERVYDISNKETNIGPEDLDRSMHQVLLYWRLGAGVLVLIKH